MKFDFIKKVSFSRSPVFWLLYATTVALACIHGGQCIVFHNALPGDLADSRLVNCTLEHVYQCLRGHGEFFSPGQFFPIKGTLVYSDNHFGTVIYYAFFRVLGASMEGAFQEWILLMLGLNTISLLYLFRQLQVDPRVACPLALFGASSSAFVFKIIHPQVLSLFPFVFCLTFICKFLVSADAKHLAWAALWFAYQNWCYTYYGYFAVYICGVITALFLALFARREFWNKFFRSLRQNWLLVSGVFFLSLVAIAAIYLPYARYSPGGETRPMVALTALAPNPGAWFSASPLSFLYGKQQFYKPDANTAENTLFSGWSFWLLVPAIIVTVLRSRDKRNMGLALVLIATVLFLIAAFTTWNQGGSIYLRLAEHIPSIRAFRAFPRIAYLLIIVEAAAIAIFLNYHYRRVQSGWGKGLVVLFACLIAGENLTVGQYSYSKIEAQERVAALVQMWNAAGGRDVLVFAPGYTSERFEINHTDAWRAALALNKKTLNGYSGNFPPSHENFIWNPTQANALALLGRLNIPRETCSIVTDWPERIKQEFNIRTYNLRGAAKPSTKVKRIDLAPSQTTSIPVSVHSDELDDLDCDFLRLNASYRLFDETGIPVSDPPSLRTPVHLLRHDEDKALTMAFQAPSAPGLYQARLSMVQAAGDWWADRGSPGSTVEIIVTGSSKYEVGRRINFGKGGESERFRVAGWNQSEDRSAWTEGKSAVLNFSGLPLSQPLTLKMTLNGLIKDPELPAQPTEVYANGKKIADWQVAKKKEYVSSIPADVVTDTGHLRLEFRLPQATSPQTLALGADSRVLGVCVYDLTISKAP